jgi:hypothetical protein
MLEKNGHINFLKYSAKVDLLIFYQLFKKGMHSTIINGRSPHENFKRAWKDSELELFAFIASNKNGRKSKNYPILNTFVHTYVTMSWEQNWGGRSIAVVRVATVYGGG